MVNKKTTANRPERATRLSEGRSPSKECVTSKPCKGVRIMRAALSGLKITVGRFVGLRPTLRRNALSGRRIPCEPFNYTEWQREHFKDMTLDELVANVKKVQGNGVKNNLNIETSLLNIEHL